MKKEKDTSSSETEMHKVTLDEQEVALLNSLSTGPARADRTKLAMAEILMDDETIDGLQRYEGFFTSADVDVSVALGALPRAMALRALKHRLDSAMAIVQRNLADTVDPIAEAASEIHRLVSGAPEHSRVKAALTLMEQRWSDSFKGGRPAKAASDASDKSEKSEKPESTEKSPKPT
jgi:hypothetical protein